MKPHHMILALGAASATAFAGTPYVAPAPAPEPAAMGWFIGGSYGQFDVDNNYESQYNDNTISSVLNDLGYDGLGLGEDMWEYTRTSGEDLDFDDLLGDLGIEDRPDYDDLLDDLNDLDKNPTDYTIGDLNEALRQQGYGLESEVSDVEFDMYTFHFGRELGCASGFDMSAYLEIGWLTGDMTYGLNYISPGDGKVSIFRDSLDIDVIPVTINFKAEHVIYGPVGAYLSGGVGYAWTNIESDDFDMDESDGGFYAQAAAGLVWNVNESFELFGGARWVHLESLDFGDSGFELEDTLGWEIGARYNF